MNDSHETNVKLQNMFSGVNLFRNVGLHSKSLQCMKDRNVSVLLETDPQVLVFSSVFGLHNRHYTYCSEVFTLLFICSL